MPKYEITLDEEWIREVIVVADSEDEAYEKIWNKEDLIKDERDLLDTKCSTLKILED